MRSSLVPGMLVAMLWLPGPARADEAADLKKAVARGLDWLAAQQHDDGHWNAGERNMPGQGGAEPTSITALAALALLMEGSTPREGKYSAHLTRTVDYFLKNVRGDGLLKGDQQMELARCMFAHSYAMLFLSQVLDVEKEGKRRDELIKVLARAVDFSAKAQTRRGGWGYVPAADGSDFDEGCVTTAQIRALFAVRDAGIAVPREVIDKAVGYLVKATTPRGGVVYSLATGEARAGGERPPITAAALACLVAADRHDEPVVKKWVGYCQVAIPPAQAGRRFGFDEYTHYYYGEALHRLGERRVIAMAPDVKAPCTWATYRQHVLPMLVHEQAATGAWNKNTNFGPVFTTALFLSVLQFETSKLPMHKN